MGKADWQIKAFVEALDMTAIWVASVTEGRCRIGVSQEPERRVSKIANASLAATWWCADYRHAMLVVSQCQGELKRRAMIAGVTDWFDMHHSDVSQLVMSVASREQVELSTEESIRQRAGATITRIETALEVLRASGGLKKVNASYREYRTALERAGQRAINYNLWIAIWKRNLIRSVAKTANQSCAISQQDIISAMSHSACTSMSSKI